MVSTWNPFDRAKDRFQSVDHYFLYQLSLHYRIPPNECLDRFTSIELTDLYYLFITEPWGDKRADYRSALQTAHLLSPWLKAPPNITDLLLNFSTQDEKRKAEIEFARMEAMALRNAAATKHK